MRYPRTLLGTVLLTGLCCFCGCDDFWEYEDDNQAETEESPKEEETPKEDTSIDLQNGLAIYYTFNDGTCTDLSGNGNNGVFNDSPAIIEDTPNGTGCALFLNAYKEQFVNIPSNPLYGLKTCTYSFWMKDFGPGFLIGAIDNERMQVPYVTCTEEALISLNDHAFNGHTKNVNTLWSMYTVTQAENEQKFYYNGTLVSTQTYYPGSSTAAKLQIGGNGGGSFGYWQSMKIDNVRVYTRALNAYEIARIYEMESK